MKTKNPLLVLTLFLTAMGSGQAKPEINITFSHLLVTYDVVQQLSDNPPGNKYKR